jgi:hypothetical protein
MEITGAIDMINRWAKKNKKLKVGTIKKAKELLEIFSPINSFKLESFINPAKCDIIFIQIETPFQKICYEINGDYIDYEIV